MVFPAQVLETCFTFACLDGTWLTAKRNKKRPPRPSPALPSAYYRCISLFSSLSTTSSNITSDDSFLLDDCTNIRARNQIITLLPSKPRFLPLSHRKRSTRLSYAWSSTHHQGIPLHPFSQTSFFGPSKPSTHQNATVDPVHSGTIRRAAKTGRLDYRHNPHAALEKVTQNDEISVRMTAPKRNAFMADLQLNSLAIEVKSRIYSGRCWHGCEE